MLKINKKGRRLTWRSIAVIFALCSVLIATPALAATISAGGSTTVYPITVAAATVWTTATGHNINISQGGSGDGRSGVMNNLLDIGNASSPMKASHNYDSNGQPDTEQVNEWIIAADMICVIVPVNLYDNGVQAITSAQVDWIYSRGTLITDKNNDGNHNDPTLWSEVPGSSGWPSVPVVPRARVIGSGTRDMFMSLTGIATADEEATINAVNDPTTGYGLSRLDGNSDMTAAINDANSAYPSQGHIGYCGLGYSEDYPGVVMPIDLDGVAPVPANFASYTLSRSLYNYTLTPMEDPAYSLVALDFVQYILSTDGADHVDDAGFIPVPYQLGTTYTWDGTLGRWDTDAPNPPPYYEIKVDGICDISDAVLLGKAWGDTGTKGWSPADIYADGIVDVSDAIWLGRNWGNYWPHS